MERAKIEVMSAPDRLIAETDVEDLVEHFASRYFTVASLLFSRDKDRKGLA